MDADAVTATATAASVLQWFAFAYAGALCKKLPPASTRTVPCSAFKAWSDRVDADVTRDIESMPDLGPRTRAALLKFKSDAMAAVASYVPSCTGSQGTIDVDKLRDFLGKLSSCQRAMPAPAIKVPGTRLPAPTPTIAMGKKPVKPPAPTPTIAMGKKPVKPPAPTPTIAMGKKPVKPPAPTPTARPPTPRPR
jgi:hypothetical protein